MTWGNLNGILQRLFGMRTILYFPILFLALPVNAGAAIWDGDAGDNRWSTPENWSGDTLPTSTENIIISGNAGLVLLDIDFTLAGQLTIGSISTSDSDILTIPNGVTLTINGDGVNSFGTNLSNVVIERSGTLINEGLVNETGRQANIRVSGNFLNFSTLSDISVDPSFQGEFTNHGEMIDGSSMVIQAGAVFNNYGTFDPARVFARQSTINNNPTGLLVFAGSTGGSPNTMSIESGTVNNFGTIINETTITIEGTLKNTGLLDSTIGTIRLTCNAGDPSQGLGVLTNTGTLIAPNIETPCAFWDNDSGNSLWSEPMNWNPDVVPDSGDIVIISGEGSDPASVILETNYTSNSTGQIVLDSESVASALTVRGGFTLNVDRLKLRENATLRVDSGGTLILGNTLMEDNSVLVNVGSTTSDGDYTLDGQSTARIDNRASLVNNGEIRVGAGVFGFGGPILIENFGVIDNLGTIFVPCESTGTFENSGTVHGRDRLQLCNIWTGLAGDGNFSTAANWSTGLAPEALDDLIIADNAGFVVLDVDFTLAGQLTIGSNSTGNIDAFAIPGSRTLTINGDGVNSGGGNLSNVVVERSGTLINEGLVNETGRQANIRVSGSFLNFGTLSDISVDPTFQGVFTNDGDMIDGSSMFIQAGGVFDNNGTFDPASIIMRDSIINNNPTGLLVFTGSTGSAPNRLFIESGTFNNHGSVLNDNTLTNQGTIDNFGTLNSTSTGGSVQNDGDLINECGAVLLGTVNGNPPIEIPCDTTPPVITVPGDITAEATSVNGAAVTFAVGAMDDTDGALTPACVPMSGATFALGTTGVSCSVTDAAGNSATASFDVHVVDTTLPELSVPADVVTEANAVLSIVSVGDATATDIFPVTISNDAPASYPLGTTEITWTAIDSNGNLSTDVQRIMVVDTTPPALSPPADVTEDATGPLTVVDIGHATAPDIFPVSIANDAPLEGFPVGTTVVMWTAVDSSGNSSTATQQITLLNDPPQLAPVVDAAIDEGDKLVLSASFTDPDSVAWTATIDYGDGGGLQALGVDDSSLTMDLSHTYVDNGTYTVTVNITDAEGAADSTTFGVIVNNVAPSLADVDVNPTLSSVSTEAITASVNFTDPGVLDSHTATIDWGDGAITAAVINENDGAGSASGQHVYDSPGVFTVTVTVTDKDGGVGGNLFQFVVIYDPDGGFVTGGGWIDSPAGTCSLTPDCVTATGKANFGFVSKYKKGALSPTGNTEFKFQAGGLNFRSSSYEWLVIAGHKAQYKGTGTINGAGNYGFMLFATDASLTPSTDDDLFRIKIWDSDNGDFVVYDNEPEIDDDAEATTTIGGGSIVIHKPKTK